MVKLEPNESADITCPDSHSVKLIPFEGEERTMEHNPTTLHGSNFTEGRYVCSHCPGGGIIAIKRAPSVEIERSCSTGAPRLDCKVTDQRFSGMNSILGLTAEKPNGNWKILETGTNSVTIDETNLPNYVNTVKCSLVGFTINETNYRLHNFESDDEHAIGPCELTPTPTQGTTPWSTITAVSSPMPTPVMTPWSNMTADSSPTPTHSPQAIAAMIVLPILLAVVLIIVLVLSVKSIKRWRKKTSSVHPKNSPSDSDKPATGPSPISQV